MRKLYGRTGNDAGGWRGRRGSGYPGPGNLTINRKLEEYLNRPKAWQSVAFHKERDSVDAMFNVSNSHMFMLNVLKEKRMYSISVRVL